MNKLFRYSLSILSILLIIVFSFDVKQLDSYKASHEKVAFDAADYALAFWTDSLPVCISGAPDIAVLLQFLASDQGTALAEYGHKLGISKTWYLMAKGRGVIDNVGNEWVTVRLQSGATINLATDFIFGNAIRDGSGKVNINDFVNMTDFNTVSVEVNKLAKAKVASRLKSLATIGTRIEFAGVAEFNEEDPDFTSATWIPVSIKQSYENQP